MTNQPQILAIPDGQLNLYLNFFNSTDSEKYYQNLYQEIKWTQPEIRCFGKKMPIPRLQGWYGDPGTSYTYSGLEMQPEPWTNTLSIIKTKIDQLTELKFNSVLINLYRSGRDSVSWHSDDESMLGQNPIIASVSFGATRTFMLRHKTRKDLEIIRLNLENGSLLLMSGSTQHFWQHQIPKTSKQITPRINLTFRIIKNLD